MLNLPTYNSTCIGHYNIYYKSNNDLTHIFNELISSEYNLTLKGICSFFENQYISGSYSIVIDSPYSTYIISDIVRTYPVLYSLENGFLAINEDLKFFNFTPVDETAVSDFIHTFFSIGSNTIFKNIKTIQAAEILFFDKKIKNLKTHRYFRYASNKDIPKVSTQNFVNQYNITLSKIFENIIKNEPTCRNWIVPLSGGHDSRQIVNSLYKLGITNVICFSYGKIDNTQARLSKEVAKALGYQWFFVEYTEEKWQSQHENGLINKYIDFAFQGTSSPHLQDFLAIYELKKKGIIKESDIVLPGHTLDMTAGGHLNELDLACKTKEQAIFRTLKRHGRLYSDISLLDINLYDRIEEIYDEVNLEPYQFQEYINWQERQAKFVVNSCRVYEFFNLEFRLPFWDKKLVEFLLELPVEQRVNRQFFKNTEREGVLIPELAKIPFEDELLKKRQKSILNSKLKNIIPNSLSVKLKVFKSIFVQKFSRKEYKAESLNQIYVLKSSTVDDLVGPLEIWPKDKNKILRPFFLLPTHKANYHTLSWMYAISLKLKKELRQC